MTTLLQEFEEWLNRMRSYDFTIAIAEGQKKIEQLEKKYHVV